MTEPGLREKKKAKTRLAISHVATQLFIERGFDAVTVADVADAAEVSKMTVFNYFAKKEDLFFDRAGSEMVLVKEALAKRPAGQSPIRAVAALARAVVEQKHPLAAFPPRASQFWRTVEKSEALRARVRELREQGEVDLAAALAEALGRKRPDADDRLFAAMIAAVWCVAYAEALRRHRAGDSSAAVRKAFRDLVDRGYRRVIAAAEGTPYA